MPASLSSARRVSPAVTGLALAVFGAVFFAGKAIVAKLMYAHGVDGISVIALRMLLSAPVFAALLIWSWRRGPRLGGREMLVIGLLGLVGYYGSSTLDFLGLERISAGLERQILFLTPTMTLLLGMLFYGRRVRSGQWPSLALAYAGIVLVFWHDMRLGGDAVIAGAAMVFLAALFYAGYLLLVGELVARVGTLRLMSIAMLVSSMASVGQYALLRPIDGLFVQTPAVWSLAALMAVLCTVLPVFLTMSAIARIGAEMTSQASMVGPVATLFLGWWLLGESISVMQMFGTMLVLAGVWWLSRLPAPADAAKRA